MQKKLCGGKCWIVVALCAIVAVLGVATAYAFTWSTETVTGAANSESIDIVVKSSTQQDVSFVDASADLYYAEQVSGVWTVYAIEAGALPDTDVPGRFQGTSIVLDTGDVPVVTFTGVNNDELWIARDDGTLSNPGDSSNWTYDILVTGTTYAPSMGLSSADVIGVAYGDTADLYYAYEDAGGSTCTLANWTCEQIDDSSWNMAPRLYFDLAVPVIAYTDGSNVKVAIRNGGGSGNCTYSTQWNCYVIDGAAGTTFAQPLGIAENASGQYIISYIASDGTTLNYAVNDGGDATCTAADWSCSAISSATDYGYPIDLGWDSVGGVPVVMANDDTNGDLEMFYNSGGWQNDSLGTFGINDYAAMDVSGSYVGVAQYVNTSGGILGYHDTTASYNTVPTVTVNSAAQKTDGSGDVDISLTLDDADDDDTLKVKVEYKAGADCSSGTSDPTLDETDADTTATYGDPKVENDDTYQVGNASGWITTSSGANTVLFDWNSATDVAAADGTYCLKFTPNDGTADGTAQSTTLTLDNVAPSGLANFAVGSQNSTSVTFTWTAVSSETNFANYEIWRDTTAGISQGGDTETEWDNSDDALLATVATATTTITSLDTTSNVYYFNMWAMDSYGNFAAQTEQYSAAIPGVPTVNGATTTSLNVTPDYNSNPATATFAIQETLSGNYVQADGSLGASAVWQDESTWGATVTVSGLSPNNPYTFAVNARNASSIETGLGTASTAVYTLANVPGVPTVTAASSTSLTVTLDVNSNPTTTTFAIQDVSSGNYVQADGSLGASEVWQINATWGTVTVTGLSVNTAYTFKVKAKNGDGTETALGTASSAVYTLANVPASAGVSVSGANISVSWSANGNPSSVQYYVTRSDSTVVQNWTTGTDLTNVSPTCGIGYTYTVKARNASSVETSTVTSSSATVSCGGVMSPSSRSRSSSSGDSSSTTAGTESGGGVEGEGADEGESGGEESSRGEVEGELVADEAEGDISPEGEGEDESEREASSDRDSTSEPAERRTEIESESTYEREEPAELADESPVVDLQENIVRDLVEDASADGEDFIAEVDEVAREIEDDGDIDGDGISNSEERAAGTDPNSADSDGDGVPDNAERDMGTDPNDANSVDEFVVSTSGSQDSDGDGVSDVVERILGTDSQNADDDAAGRFFGTPSATDVDAPTFTVGTFNNMASSGGSGAILPGKYKPNKEVTINVKSSKGVVLKTLSAKTDDEGKFIAPFLALYDVGVSEGDSLVLTVEAEGKKSKPVVLKVGKETSAPEVEVSGVGVEVLEDVDVDEFDHEVAQPVKWYRVVIVESAPLYVKGTRFEERFVAELNGLRAQPENTQIFAGTARPRTRIVFFFESLITTSVVITDADGRFEISVPKGLEEGVHKFTGFEANLKKGTVSSPVRGVLSMVSPNRILDEIMLKFAVQ